MQLSVLDSKAGNATSKVDVAEDIFAKKYNEALIHQVVTAYLAGARAGTKAQKTRSEVRGGGRKPWRQKGTGNARAGTIRSPIWRSGGITFAAKPRDYSQKVNRKMYQGAIRSIFSELIRQDRLVIVKSLEVADAKTKTMMALLKKLELTNVLIITETKDENICRSARNIPNVAITEINQIDPVSLIAHDKVLITLAALEKAKEIL